jgi:hypothetical protein
MKQRTYDVTIYGTMSYCPRVVITKEDVIATQRQYSSMADTTDEEILANDEYWEEALWDRVYRDLAAMPDLEHDSTYHSEHYEVEDGEEDDSDEHNENAEKTA